MIGDTGMDEIRRDKPTITMTKKQIPARMWNKRNSFITDWSKKWYSHFGRQFGNF